MYSQTLIRKLEEKTLQLEESNRALQDDLVHREAVEAALRRSEEEFRLLTEAMPQIVWMSATRRLVHARQPEVDRVTPDRAAESRAIGDGWTAALRPRRSAACG